MNEGEYSGEPPTGNEMETPRIDTVWYEDE